MDDRLDAVFDEYLDRALRGDNADVDDILRVHPELNPDERQRFRAMAEAIAGDSDAAGASDLAADEDLPFERLGEFRLIRKLGEGGMGAVYLAEQVSLRRLVALKVIRPERAGSPDAVARLRREAQAIARLRHPNIVSVFASGEEKGNHYLAMELVPGKALDQILREATVEGRRVPIPLVLRWVADVARALQCVHDAGIIHRDVKPSNVRVTPEGKALLVDFGLVLNTQSATVTVTGLFRGTPHYASPEQVAANRIGIDARTDVYSLGVMLYESVTGKVPFEGDTAEQVFNQILVKEPVPPRRLNPEIPRDLETVVQTAIEKDRERRYPTARAVAEEIEAVLELRPIVAKPAGPVTRTVKWARRNRATATAASMASVTALAVVTIVIAVRLGAAREFGLVVARGDAAAKRGEFDTALHEYRTALEVRPSDGIVRDKVRDVEDRRRHSQAGAMLAKATEARQGVERNAERLADLISRQEALEYAVTTRHMSEEEQAERTRLRRERTQLQRKVEEEFHRAVELVNVGRSLDATHPLVRETSKQLCLDRWRAAMKARDSESAAYWWSRVEENDPERVCSAELRGEGSVTINSDPPGASVYLFEYVEHSEIVADGEARLVPVPFGRGKTQIPPGTCVERVVRDGGGVRVGDLIVEISGVPVAGAVYVLEAREPVKPLDRLVAIDGRGVRGAAELTDPEPQAGVSAPIRVFEFARAGSRFEVRGTSLEDIGVLAGNSHALLARRPAPAKVYRNGDLVDISLTPRVETVLTAAPFFTSDACLLGRTPIIRRSLLPGSYVAVLRLEGREEEQYPFVVPRSEAVHLSTTLDPLETTPRGFVRVPAGPFVAGGNPLAYGGWPRRSIELPDFWMQIHEVLCGEFLNYLNDRETQREIAASEKPIRAPRKENVEGVWDRLPDGRFELRTAAEGFPVSGISRDDADAYARWMTQRARQRGQPFVFALPTEEEWEKAARGADERGFAFGNTFVPAWAKTLFSTPTRGPDVVLRYVRDESPFGVFDLTGSVTEWVAPSPSDDSAFSRTRGGSYAKCNPSDFFVSARTSVVSPRTFAGVGFRLVAHRVP